MAILTTQGFEAPLVERREVAQDTMAFRFGVNGHAPSFLAGQACNVKLPDGQSHQFAIASSPTNGRTVMIAARMRDTPFKETLAAMVQRRVRPDLLAKAMVYVSGPPQMVHDMATVARSLGVSTANLKLDEFRGY